MRHNSPKFKSLVMTEPGRELSSVCYQERDGEAVEADDNIIFLVFWPGMHNLNLFMKKYQTNQNEHHSFKYGVGEDCILQKSPCNISRRKCSR